MPQFTGYAMDHVPLSDKCVLYIFYHVCFGYCKKGGKWKFIAPLSTDETHILENTFVCLLLPYLACFDSLDIRLSEEVTKKGIYT